MSGGDQRHEHVRLALTSDNAAHELVGVLSIGTKDYRCACGDSISVNYFAEIEGKFAAHVRAAGGRVLPFAPPTDD